MKKIIKLKPLTSEEQKIVFNVASRLLENVDAYESIYSDAIYKTVKEIVDLHSTGSHPILTDEEYSICNSYMLNYKRLLKMNKRKLVEENVILKENILSLNSCLKDKEDKCMHFQTQIADFISYACDLGNEDLIKALFEYVISCDNTCLRFIDKSVITKLYDSYINSQSINESLVMPNYEILSKISNLGFDLWYGKYILKYAYCKKNVINMIKRYNMQDINPCDDIGIQVINGVLFDKIISALLSAKNPELSLWVAMALDNDNRIEIKEELSTIISNRGNYTACEDFEKTYIDFNYQFAVILKKQGLNELAHHHIMNCMASSEFLANSVNQKNIFELMDWNFNEAISPRTRKENKRENN